MTMLTATSAFTGAAFVETRNWQVEQASSISIPSGYVAGAISRRTSRQLGDGTWIGEIPGFEGVWSQGDTETQALMALHDVLIGWLMLKIEDNDRDIPVIGGIDLNK